MNTTCLCIAILGDTPFPFYSTKRKAQFAKKLSILCSTPLSLSDILSWNIACICNCIVLTFINSCILLNIMGYYLILRWGLLYSFLVVTSNGFKSVHELFFYCSDMRSVANHLCQEFMSDIIGVTDSSEDDDVTPLQNYLLRERGWLLLYTIHKNGTQVGDEHLLKQEY